MHSWELVPFAHSSIWAYRASLGLSLDSASVFADSDSYGLLESFVQPRVCSVDSHASEIESHVVYDALAGDQLLDFGLQLFAALHDDALASKHCLQSSGLHCHQHSCPFDDSLIWPYLALHEEPQTWSYSFLKANPSWPRWPPFCLLESPSAPCGTPYGFSPLLEHFQDYLLSCCHSQPLCPTSLDLILVI